MSQHPVVFEKSYRSTLGRERAIARDVYASMIKLGLKPSSLLKFDVEFKARSIEALSKLAAVLVDRFGYTMQAPKRRWPRPRLEGETTETMVDDGSLLIWVSEMVLVAHTHGCELGDWGAMHDPSAIRRLDENARSAKEWFDLAVQHFEAQRLTDAFCHFRAATLADGAFADGYDGMGTVAQDLGCLKQALDFYDQAIVLAPEDPSFYLNRGSVRDYSGDYDGALADYASALALRPHYATAYFNRGNTWMNLENREAACQDWRQAKELGEESAEERLDRYCRTES